MLEQDQQYTMNIDETEEDLIAGNAFIIEDSEDFTYILVAYKHGPKGHFRVVIKTSENEECWDALYSNPKDAAEKICGEVANRPFAICGVYT